MGPLTRHVEFAQRFGVRVYTVGFGTKEGGTIDFDGWSAYVMLDEETLKQVAKITDAEYFHAGTAADLKRVYQTLNAFFEGLVSDPAAEFVLEPATGRMLLRRVAPAGPMSLPASAITQVLTATTEDANCDVNNSSSVDGDSRSGSITGRAVFECVRAENRKHASVIVEITAQKQGDDLTGTIRVRFTDYDGHVETVVVPPKVITKFYIDNILGSQTVTWTFTASRG